MASNRRGFGAGLCRRFCPDNVPESLLAEPFWIFSQASFVFFLSPDFFLENAATIDKVTVVGISAPGLAHGSYSADGSSAGATLARFQVTGGPGSNMVFRPPNPIKVDISHLIGGTVEQIKLMLVDQHGKQISSLLGKKFSCVLVIDSE